MKPHRQNQSRLNLSSQSQKRLSILRRTKKEKPKYQKFSTPSYPFASRSKNSEDEDHLINEEFNIELLNSMSDATSTGTYETEDKYIVHRSCK